MRLCVLFSVALMMIELFAVPQATAQTYASAERLGLVNTDVMGCPAGAFWDPRNFGECWTCDGASRTVAPVTADIACETRGEAAQSAGIRQTSQMATCPKGTWHDIAAGECLSCPSTHKNIAGTCVRVTGGDVRGASTHHRKTILQKCGGGTFAGIDPTRCYTCPKGYTPKASLCVKPITTSKYRGKPVKQITTTCEKGVYAALLDGGSCWTCPDDYAEVGLPGLPGFCVRAAFSKFGPARMVSKRPITKVNFAEQAAALGCGKYGKGAFFDPAGGGTCWSCPASHPNRTLFFSVESDKACSRTRNAACETVLDAIGAAKIGMEQALAEADDLSAVIDKPIPGLDQLRPLINQAMDLMEDAQAKAMETLNVDELLVEVAKALPDPGEAAKIDRVVSALTARRGALTALLLDKNVMCYGDKAPVEALVRQTLEAAGLPAPGRAELRHPGASPDRPIRYAAATGEETPFSLTLSAAFNVTFPIPVPNTVAAVPFSISLQGSLQFYPSVDFAPSLAFSMDETKNVLQEFAKRAGQTRQSATEFADIFGVSFSLAWIPPVPGACDDGVARPPLPDVREQFLQLAENLTVTGAFLGNFGTGLTPCADAPVRPRLSGIGVTPIGFGVNGFSFLEELRDIIDRKEFKQRPTIGLNSAVSLVGRQAETPVGLIQ